MNVTTRADECVPRSNPAGLWHIGGSSKDKLVAEHEIDCRAKGYSKEVSGKEPDPLTANDQPRKEEVTSERYGSVCQIESEQSF